MQIVSVVTVIFTVFDHVIVVRLVEFIQPEVRWKRKSWNKVDFDSILVISRGKFNYQLLYNKFFTAEWNLT